MILTSFRTKNGLKMSDILLHVICMYQTNLTVSTIQPYSDIIFFSSDSYKFEGYRHQVSIELNYAFGLTDRLRIHSSMKYIISRFMNSKYHRVIGQLHNIYEGRLNGTMTFKKKI